MKYRKKPVIIEAEVYHIGMEDGFDPCGHCPFPIGEDPECNECGNRRPFIRSLEGKLYISSGDYIITGVNGERYPCKPDIFKKTYEPVPNYPYCISKTNADKIPAISPEKMKQMKDDIGGLRHD